ncbi:unnamed protein product [Moneuplotes crassus]|uniref:SKP1 component dimerisation domain-containing protein n=1 Tax=Euplotes crassus TaxID=5936 RepID=A0AAD1XVW0_EUPCR|nr:unnamed protein product [Moneuplotes crassus]
MEATEAASLPLTLPQSPSPGTPSPSATSNTSPIKITLSDTPEGTIHHLPTHLTSQNLLIRSIIEDSDYDPLLPIHLREVSSSTFPHILTYLNLYSTSPYDFKAKVQKPLQSNILSDVIPEEYAKFISEFTLEEVYELLCAANYLDNQGLLLLSSIRIASEMRGKSVEELREMFGVEPGFSKEELKEIEEEEKRRDFEIE